MFRRRRMTCCVGCLEARHQDTADNDGQVLLREGVRVSLVFITWDPTASCVTVCISDWRVSPELSVGEHAASLKKRSPISGWTAVMIAAESGHVDCTQELLESGAEKAGGVCASAVPWAFPQTACASCQHCDLVLGCAEQRWRGPCVPTP